MSRRQLVLISIYGALPAALVFVLFIGWRLALEKSTFVLQSANSPNGRYRAEVVREDPGSSSNYEYKVRIIPAHLTVFEQTLLPLSFGPQYTAIDAHREPDKITAEWTGPNQLIILCQGCNGAAVGIATWRDIQLRYDLR